MGGLVLGGLQLLDFGGQLGVLLGQIARIRPGLLQPFARGLQLLVLPLQGRLGRLDAFFQLDLFPLQTGGGALRLINLLLKKLMLLLQAFCTRWRL